MRQAVRRSGGRAVCEAALAALVLSASPPDRLTAQSVRSAGLAGAGVALVGDAGSMFANPAGLATIRHVALEGSYETYPGGTSVYSVAAAARLGRFDYGIAAQTEHLPVKTTGKDVLAMSALVFRFGMIAVGTSLKYVREGVSVPQGESWAGDAGVAIALFDIFALGASVQNLGGDLGSGAHLQRRTRVGFTMNYVDPQGTVRLLTTFEGQWPEGRSPVLVAGVEGGVVTRGGGGGGGGGIGIIGRVGVTGHSAPSDASPVAVGAGVELGRLHLDYAYQSFAAPGGGAHRFGARWTP